ncbi:hypothetical protein ZHAS_00006642 [Anopheles sinensis]|uniref:Uncharacterized protein n=1 Tax=Anopheles sinensis TaxID=74873 RepID=A0A084VMU5_ANOSI|nr:hypothetical protein ZHAS_00006642 [Anopheles sinensis]
MPSESKCIIGQLERLENLALMHFPSRFSGCESEDMVNPPDASRRQMVTT